MSLTIKCPACLVSFITIDNLGLEFQYNLLKAENERFRKALEKYADPERHSMDPSGFVWSGDYFDYETARAALEGE